MTRVLAVRLDNAGDVLLAGPALRALAAGADRLDLLVSDAGAPAAELLPGIDDDRATGVRGLPHRLGARRLPAAAVVVLGAGSALVLLGAEGGKWEISVKLNDGEKVVYEVAVHSINPAKASEGDASSTSDTGSSASASASAAAFSASLIRFASRWGSAFCAVLAAFFC